MNSYVHILHGLSSGSLEYTHSILSHCSTMNNGLHILEETGNIYLYKSLSTSFNYVFNFVL